jgi:hypothetical protein
LPDRPGGIRHDPGEVQLGDPAESLAVRAGAERAIEPQQVGLGLDLLGPASAASPASYERPGLVAGDDPAAAEPPRERRFDRVEPPRRRVSGAHQAVDDDVHRTGLGQDEAGIIQTQGLAVEDDPGESLCAEPAQQGVSVAFRAEIHGEGDLITRLRRQGIDRGRDRGGSRRLHARAAVPADHLPCPGEQQREGVVDLGDRADGAAAGVTTVRLPDRDRGRNPVDPVRVRLVEFLEELAGVGRKGLDVAPLALGVDRVEGQRALSRAADPRHRDLTIERQVEIQPLEVVSPHATQVDRTRGIDGHWKGGVGRIRAETANFPGNGPPVARRAAPNRFIRGARIRAPGASG